MEFATSTITRSNNTKYYSEMIGQLHAPAALHPQKEPQYPLDRRVGGP
jgi:hypothetical protein